MAITLRPDDAPAAGTTIHERGATGPARWRDRLRRAVALIHRIIGAPDYEGYLAHVRRCHPDRPPLSRDEFVRQRLEDRYSRPGARCC